MTNSWSLLYDEMYGPEDERDYIDWGKIYQGTHNDYELTADGFLWPKDGRPLADDRPIVDEEIDYLKNTLNINYGISTMSEDTIKLNIDNNNGFWKYEEDLTLKEVQDYLSGTYRAHYTSQESKTQTLDLIESIGDAEAFCRSNAIKYLSRFGKKNGKSKLDILKAIHYCVLLYHFSGLHKQTKGNYETF